MQGLMVFDTFFGDLGDGTERKFLAWQGGVARGSVPKGTGDWVCEVFQSLLAYPGVNPVNPLVQPSEPAAGVMLYGLKKRP